VELVHQPFCIIFIYFAVPVIAPPVDAPCAAHGTAPTGPASDLITSPKHETKVGPTLLVSDVVPRSPDALSVNRKEQSYITYKVGS